MDLRRGFLIPEESKYQIQGSWAPVTPTKPIPTRFQPISGDMQENQSHPGNINWLQSLGFPAQLPTSNRASICLNSEGSMEQNRRVTNWQETLAGRNITSDNIVGPYPQSLTSTTLGSDNMACTDLLALTNATVGLNNIAYTNLLAITNAASASSASEMQIGNTNAARSPFIPITYSHIHSNQQQSKSAASTTMQTAMQGTSNTGMYNPFPTIPHSQTNGTRQQAYSAVSECAALRENNNTSSSQFLPFMCTQNDSIRQYSDSVIMMFANKDKSESSQTWTNNCQPPTSQCGILAPYRSVNNLDSSHKTMLDAFSNGNMAFPFVPVTPDNCKRVGQISEIENGHVDDQSNKEKVKQLVGSQTVNEDTEFHNDEPLVQLMESPSASFLSPRKENQNSEKRQHHDIDLNVTPQQKPRRKKHRPKVVIEGKPKRTPRPATPKQAITKEKPSGKRKYVRKNGLNASKTPLDVVRENANPADGAVVKTCRRVLNFSSEGQATDAGTIKNYQETPHSSVENSSSGQGLDFGRESQAKDLLTRINSSQTKSLQLTEELHILEENSPACLPFDLNHSLTQVPSDYISLPEKPSPATLPPRGKEVPREDLEGLAMNRNERGAAATFLKRGDNGYSPMPQETLAEEIEDVTFGAKTALRSGHQSISNGRNHSNRSTRVLLAESKHVKGLKRGYESTTDKIECRSINLIGSHFNSLEAYQEIHQRNDCQQISNLGLHFPQIYKKKRTEKGQNTFMPSKSSMTAMLDGARQATACKENVPNNNLLASQANNGQPAPQFNNGNGTTNLNNGGKNSLCNQYAHPIATGYNSKAQNTSAEIPSWKESQTGTAIDKQKCSKFMLTLNQAEMKTKKRSKVPTRVRNFGSLTSIAECHQLQPAPLKIAPEHGDSREIKIFNRPQGCMEALAIDAPAKMPKKKRSKKESPLVNSARLRKHEIAAASDHLQSIDKSRGPSQVSRPYMIPFDDIIQMLNFLSINGSSKKIVAQEETAIVPFGGLGTVVPYEGTKKRQPRPKVDLDPETDRVWKLLMGKDVSEGFEETGADKERWWEEERRVFRGRAESFIARMHLVQGDRRFSQWKGSVVDSVIGVFLTQNVSDHLSSSAFMSLAARFPLQSASNNRNYEVVGTDISNEEPDACIVDLDDTEWQIKISSEQVCDQGSITLHEAEHVEEREVTNSNELFESNSEGDSSAKKLEEKLLVVCESRLEMCCKTSENRTKNPTIGTGKESFVEEEDRGPSEDIVSSQNSEVSSIFQTAERTGSCYDSNSEADLITGYRSMDFDGTSFMELLRMANKTMLQEYHNPGNGSLSSGNTQSEGMESNKVGSSLDRKDCLKESFLSNYASNSSPSLTEVPIIPSSNYHLYMKPYSGVPEVVCPELSGEESRYSFLSTASEFKEIKDLSCMRNRCGPMAEISSETTAERNISFSEEATPAADPYRLPSNHSGKAQINSGQEANFEKHPHSCNNHLRESTDTSQTKSTPISEPKILVEALTQRNSGKEQNHSNLPDFSRETLDVVESTHLKGRPKYIENKLVETKSKEQVYSFERVSSVTTTNTSKGKGRSSREKKATYDWDSLRKGYLNRAKRERSSNTMDSLDWEAVRCADVNVIADTIKERGMNNMLAERIKDFLNRLVREHESIDLEWLRDAPPDKVKEYLLSIRGLGLKSVECVRLLTLHHLAFPVDTNVGRIAVRLGWVPLQPLPESLQLHLLELYPMLESIQKYLWPRLCTLDQRTLYELHYQMITFGKVFCTKSKPNCNACPMRAECKHFASAFASARLALPGPEEKGMVTSTIPVTTDRNPAVGISPLALPLPEANQLWDTSCRTNQRDPIIEEPATPEPECIEISESDIEDAFFEDPEEIPMIKLNIEDFTLNLQNYMQENNKELQEGDMSKALVALTPEAASIPMPKLKNVSRLRTEHQVYELPDSHPLLKELDKREPDDPCSYLLAIWTPGETAESIQPPEDCSASQESGNLCNKTTCFSCNSIREASSQTVRGTILIPCKTAMRGSFPLNGTYFQVNEVFADHDSSLCPINIPRAWIWNLPRRTVFFGTSIPSIFKGLSTEIIQNCFWRGYVCVRGFDQKTRAPRPLRARLHFPVSKLPKTRTRTGNA